MDITCHVGCLGWVWDDNLVFCCRSIAVSYSMFALDFRFVLPFVLLVAAVALIEERIEVEFSSLDER
jgi:hypothetical protein